MTQECRSDLPLRIFPEAKPPANSTTAAFLVVPESNPDNDVPGAKERWVGNTGDMSSHRAVYHSCLSICQIPLHLGWASAVHLQRHEGRCAGAIPGADHLSDV
ncbi:hypothetical protein CEXT_355831 [Caerostris extrusa]|uniref:Uncharacterized protein n=1 Tax=Caerostris extrusa TaxID=172846 RepID=A0AAV4PQJ9_CAEEX|nr:hypothetical protein CEXT_355831 [Caerostris extrusa]